MGRRVLFWGKGCVWEGHKSNICFGDIWETTLYTRVYFCIVQHLLPSISSWICPLLILLCKKLSRLPRSSRVFTDAYWRLPISPRRDCRSWSLVARFLQMFSSLLILIGLMSFTYCVWSTGMEKSSCWWIWRPVNTKFWFFRQPNRNFCSRRFIFLSNSALLPADKPSSTWTHETLSLIAFACDKRSKLAALRQELEEHQNMQFLESKGCSS